MKRWASFLRMTYAEMIVPVVVALASVSVLLLLLFEWHAPRWLLLAPVAGFLGANFWGWTASFRHLRALEDLPLSRIASCAQGYARLEGKAGVFPGKPGEAPLISPVTRQPCAWYHYTVVTFDMNGEQKDRTVDESIWSFSMRDTSGECIVDPAGAEIIPVRVTQYRDKAQHWVERSILAGDSLSVIGQFTTASPDVSEEEIKFRVGELLSEWKRERSYTEAEWDGVRAEARARVMAQIAQEPPLAQNRIEKPADDRPFVISGEPTDQLERDLTIWAAIHAFLFVAGVATLAWLYFRFF